MFRNTTAGYLGSKQGMKWDVARVYTYMDEEYG